MVKPGALVQVVLVETRADKHSCPQPAAVPCGCCCCLTASCAHQCDSCSILVELARLALTPDRYAVIIELEFAFFRPVHAVVAQALSRINLTPRALHVQRVQTLLLTVGAQAAIRHCCRQPAHTLTTGTGSCATGAATLLLDTESCAAGAHTATKCWLLCNRCNCCCI